MSCATVILSIITLVQSDLTAFLLFKLPNALNNIKFVFFLCNLVLVISSILWMIITAKYDINSIGLQAEKYKDIQVKIENAKTKEEAEIYFKEYQDEKPKINDLIFLNKKKINKRLRENGKEEYEFNVCNTWWCNLNKKIIILVVLLCLFLCILVSYIS